MSTFANKFENFWTELDSCPFALPPQLKDIAKAALIKAGLDVPSTVTVVQNTSKGGKKLSGYNVFMRETMAQLKAEGVPTNERMTKIGAMWSALSDADKGTWNAKAGVGTSKTKASGKGTGGKKMSGYNFYLKEQMAIIKLDTSVAPSERMTKIGATWSALDQATKDAYKVKAQAV